MDRQCNREDKDRKRHGNVLIVEKLDIWQVNVGAQGEAEDGIKTGMTIDDQTTEITNRDSVVTVAMEMNVVAIKTGTGGNEVTETTTTGKDEDDERESTR